MSIMDMMNKGKGGGGGGGFGGFGGGGGMGGMGGGGGGMGSVTSNPWFKAAKAAVAGIDGYVNLGKRKPASEYADYLAGGEKPHVTGADAGEGGGGVQSMPSDMAAGPVGPDAALSIMENRPPEEPDWGSSFGGDSGFQPMVDGQVVTQPTQALIGEDGPEMVVPLNYRASAKARPGMAFGQQQVRKPRAFYGEGG